MLALNGVNYALINCIYRQATLSAVRRALDARGISLSFLAKLSLEEAAGREAGGTARSAAAEQKTLVAKPLDLKMWLQIVQFSNARPKCW